MSRLRRTAAAIGVLTASAMVVCQQPPMPKPQPQPKTIHGEGCVEAGVEARCLVVRDVAHAKLYSILVGDPRPTPGEGVEFTGIVHQGPTVCMQGTAIEVEHWQRKEGLKCQHTPAPHK